MIRIGSSLLPIVVACTALAPSLYAQPAGQGWGPVQPVGRIQGTVQPARQVSGTVRDENGGSLPGATATLKAVNGDAHYDVVTDTTGVFRFDAVPPGRYTLTVQLDGFTPATMDAAVPSQGGLPPFKIVLRVSNVEEEVTVSARAGVTALAADANAEQVELDQDALRRLPSDGQDIVAVLSNFLSPAAGAQGASIVVDGVEGDRLDIPASALHRVFVARSPFAIEYGRPGKARIEAETDIGSRRYFRGSVGLFVRNSVLDSRQAFAPSKLPLDRRLLEGTLSGPLGGKWSFLSSAEHLTDNESALVNAVTLTGPVVGLSPTPRQRTTALGRVDWRPNRSRTLTLRYDVFDESEPDRGVGGFRLADQAYASSERRHRVHLSEHEVVSGALFNDLNVQFEANAETQGGPAAGPALVVSGAFTGGPSQTFQHETSRVINLQDIATINRGRHLVRAGGVLRPKWVTTLDASNFGGTFTFSSLAQLASGRASTFRLDRGQPQVDFTDHTAAAFVEDAVSLRSNVSLTAGLRYDWQNQIHDAGSLGPRLTIAARPTEGNTVVRAGIGLFHEHLPDAAISRALLLDGSHLEEIVVDGARVANPVASNDDRAQVPSIVRIDPSLHASSTLQAIASLEQPITKKLQVTFEYQMLRSDSVFRIVDVNAALPSAGERPNPRFLIIDQVESSGMRHSNAFVTTLRGRIGQFKGTVQYTLSKTTDNVSGLFVPPADNFNLAAETGRADFDRRHRFNLAGTYEWPSAGLRVSTVVAIYSGAPFDITTGSDDNKDSVVNDRPAGVTRNTGLGPGFAQVDARITKAFHLPHLFSMDPRQARKREEIDNFEMNVDVFNLANRVNYPTFVGVLSSPFFGQANLAKQARTGQVSIKYRF